MNYTRTSFLISVTFHLILIILMIIIKVSGNVKSAPEYIDLNMEFVSPEPEQEIRAPEVIPEPVQQEPRPVIPIDHPEMAVEDEPPVEEEKEEPDPRNSILFIPKTREDSLKVWADDLKNYFTESRAVPQGFDIYSFLEMDPKKLLDSLDRSIDENAKVEELFRQPLRKIPFQAGWRGYAAPAGPERDKCGGLRPPHLTYLKGIASIKGKCEGRRPQTPASYSFPDSFSVYTQERGSSMIGIRARAVSCFNF